MRVSEGRAALPRGSPNMHSWIFRNILQLEAIYSRRAQRRRRVLVETLGPPLLPIRVLVPQPRIPLPRRAA